jgi:hypothetical protein
MTILLTLAATSANRYSAHMRWDRIALLASIAVGATASSIFSAEQTWAGEYADKKFLNGQAVFQMSIQQSGNAIQVAFDAAYVDAHGAAPEGDGRAEITGANTLEFKWEDSFKNSGTGTIKRTTDGVIVSMKPTRVVDPRCLAFYGQRMPLKRMK